jgi:hypothetical protein
VTKKSKSQKLQASDPEKKLFDPELLDRTVIAIPQLRDLAKNPSKAYDVIIHLKYSLSRRPRQSEGARNGVAARLRAFSLRLLLRVWGTTMQPSH